MVVCRAGCSSIAEFQDYGIRSADVAAQLLFADFWPDCVYNCQTLVLLLAIMICVDL